MTDISVVIPFFNGGTTIRESVLSVLAQEGPTVEIILVDDCSDDDPVPALGALGAQLTILRNAENRGPGATRNVGLARASGRYVCFLDQDDRYLPGFLSAAMALLEANAEWAAITAGITLIDCHREVSPAHHDMIAASIPSNILLRTVVANVMGGFPELAAFRQKMAGEDIAFRNALTENFQVRHIARPFLEYRIRRDSAFDLFVTRASEADGVIPPSAFLEEERDGSLSAANRHYRASVSDRVNAIRGLPRPPSAREALADFFPLHRKFMALRNTVPIVGSGSDAEEGFALYQWSREGKGVGAVVDIGRHPVASTGWLDAGAQILGRAQVLTLNHQDRTASVAMIRLLVLHGDAAYEVCRDDLDRWLRLVETCGAFALCGVGILPGISRLHADVRMNNAAVREVCSVGSLRIFAQR